MKKTVLFLLIGVMISFVNGYAEEQAPQQPMMSSERTLGIVNAANNATNPMMMAVMKPTMVATADGGVALQMGPKLIKYDKDLNLVKEVDLPAPKKPQP